MSKIIINLMDGTLCEFTGTVIVDLETLDEAGIALYHEWLEGFNGGTACDIGEKYGVPLENLL